MPGTGSGADVPASTFSVLSYTAIFCDKRDAIRSLKLPESQRRADPAAQSLQQSPATSFGVTFVTFGQCHQGAY